jgi:hypothetical protein
MENLFWFGLTFSNFHGADSYNGWLQAFEFQDADGDIFGGDNGLMVPAPAAIPL